MRKALNILLLVFTLAALISLSVYYIYEHFHNSLEDVKVTIIRNGESGFVDYEKTYDKIVSICDTVNNNQIFMIPLDSVVNMLEANPWVIDVDAEINLKSVLDIEITECEPIMRVYNTKGKSVYLDTDGNVFPTNNSHVKHLLVGSGYVNFPVDKLGNIGDEAYADTDLPEMYQLMKAVLADEYSRNCVKQIYRDNKKNYIFSLNITNIIVIFGEINDIEEKLAKMQIFFNKMQGNPELEKYKEINLNYKNQVVCTKK
jgi:cell division protein FtsQ